VKLEKWLVSERAQLHRGAAVAVIVASGIRYEVRANGDGFLRKRLVKKGEISPSTPLAIIAADGESIPYGKPYSVAHRLTKNTGRHGKRFSLWSRSWRFVKRILKTPLYPNTTTKGMRQGLIARLILYGIIFVVSLYFEVPAIWWFMVGAIVCGIVVAIAIRRVRDREQQ
jgi:hypothetical protein